MARNIRLLVGAGLLPALAVCLLSMARAGAAADDVEKEVKAAAESILRLADAIDKDNKDAVQEEMAKLKRMDLLPIMIVLKKRTATPPGIGFGPKGAYPDEDGIEFKITRLGQNDLPPAMMKKQAEDIRQAALITQAIAEVAATKCPIRKPMGGADPKDWAKWSQDMQDAAKALGDAARKGDPKGVKDAAGKLNASCTYCHGVFR